MARAVWKGPFVDENLMKKVDKIKNALGFEFEFELEDGLRQTLA